MNVKIGDYNFYFENTEDFLLLSNLRDSEITEMTLDNKKFNINDMIFIYRMYKKKYDIRLKENAVTFYEPEVYNEIKFHLQKENSNLQACTRLLNLSLYLGYTKLSGVLLLFKHFLTEKKDLIL
jgi:hypothetical protein